MIKFERTQIHFFYRRQSLPSSSSLLKVLISLSSRIFQLLHLTYRRYRFWVHCYFFIYISNISESSKLLSFLLFEDDTSLFCSHVHQNSEILNQIAHQEMCKVADWFRANKIHLITLKLKNKKKPSKFEINSTRFLGLIIEKNYLRNNILNKWKQKYKNLRYNDTS